MKIPIVIIAALAGSASMAVAAPVVIDFEDRAGGELVTTQYTAQGITFSNSNWVYDDFADDYGGQGGRYFLVNVSNAIQIDLAADRTGFSANIGSYSEDTVVDFYNAGNTLIHTIAVGLNLDNNTMWDFEAFSWGGTYRKVILHDSGYQIGIDDLVLGAEAVPLPTTAAMGGLGLIGLGARRRRRVSL